MPRFRCFFIDQSDRVGSFESCDGASDAEAVDRACELLRHNPDAVAVEVWESGHFVARIPREIGKDRT